jgi:riboflavin synthase
MFTGIIENTGKITQITKNQSNITFWLQSPLTPELKIDQSVSHNGVCLTVVAIESGCYAVTAVDETLQKTNLRAWTVGTCVNLERCMAAYGRFDGHIVQGHVDQTGRCVNVVDVGGSWLFDFEYDASQGNITVEKGSICINGVSLTVFNSGVNTFRVTIIPYTYEHTNFCDLRSGDVVNLEFDIVGKYLQKMMLGTMPRNTA